MNAETIQASITKKLEEWVETIPNADRPIVGLAGDAHSTLSPRDILLHVKRRTEFGQRLMERWFQLALDHILSAQLGPPGG